MKHRFVPLFLVVALGMLLGGCVLDMTSPEAFEESLSKAGQAFDPSGGPTGFGSGGSNPDGMATGGSGSGGDGGDGGPPPDGWPPGAGPGPDATPSDSFSDDDGTTYGEYEFDSYEDLVEANQEVHHDLTESGFEFDSAGSGPSGEGDDLRIEYKYSNEETGETVVVGHGQRSDGSAVLDTTYIP